MSSIPALVQRRAPRTAVQGVWAPSTQPSSYKGIFIPFCCPSGKFNTNLAAAAGSSPGWGAQKGREVCMAFGYPCSVLKVSAARELLELFHVPQFQLQGNYSMLSCTPELWLWHGSSSVSGFSCSLPCFALF